MPRSLSSFVLLAAVGLTACGSESTDPESEAVAGAGGNAGSNGTAGNAGTLTGGTGGMPTGGTGGMPTSGTGGMPTGGTGGTGGSGDMTHRFPACVEGDNDDLCLPSGFPFAQAAFAHSYCVECVAPGGSLELTHPEPGKLCLSGNLDTEELNAGGIILTFPAFSPDNLTPDHQTIVRRFDAVALGIAQVRVTIDRPPPGGILLWANTLHKDECTQGDCVTWGFEVEQRITESGTVTVPLSDYVHEDGIEFDTRSIGDMAFDAEPGEVDYCIRDLQFLDAAGNEVLPEE